MIGKNYIEIGAGEFIKGMSTSPDITDGGFSNETAECNLIKTPGTLYGVSAVIDKSTNLTGSAIAYCQGKSSTAVNGFILAGDGKIMSIDSNQALTASSALAGTYTIGTSDIINFAGYLFATSTTDVARMNTDLTAGDATWWSATATGSGAPFGVLSSGVRHPLVEFNGYVWVGDLNRLHRIDSGAAGVEAYMSLDSSNEITALGVDGSSSSMLIATTKAANYSGTLSSGYRIYVFDGVSTTPAREIFVEAMVTGFKSVGGITYVTYGQKLGYWNGSGITFLRKFKNVTLAGSDLAYKNKMANIENTLYVVDGKQVLAYGEVLPGSKVFYYAQSNGVNSNKYTLICPVGDNKLGLGFDTTKFYTFDVTGATIGTSVIVYSNRYSFPRPVYIRGAYIEYTSAVANEDSTRSLSYMTQDQRLGFVGTSTLTNSSGNNVYEIADIKGFPSIPIKMLQLQYVTGTAGLRRIVIYYDIAE